MSSKLSVLVPITVTSDMLISSTIAETDYSAYSAATTYALGDRCISTATHKIYESLQDDNVNHDPTDIANRLVPTLYWQEVGPTNRWLMFDGEKGSASTHATDITVVVRPGHFNGFYLGGLSANNLAVTIRSTPGGDIIFSYTASLEGSAPDDYYEYFFSTFNPQKDFIVSGLEAWSTAEITLSLTGSNVSCGILSFGDLRELGETQYGAKSKPKTYSYIKVDDFGNNTIVRRKSAIDMSASSMLDLSEANNVIEIIRSLLDVPCVWIGSDLPEYGGLRVYGLGSGEISYDHPQDCMLTLTVQGLI
jgi:hypothetical protein